MKKVEHCDVTTDKSVSEIQFGGYQTLVFHVALCSTLLICLKTVFEALKIAAKPKSKATNSFLEKNLIIFLIIKTQMLAYFCLKL